MCDRGTLDYGQRSRHESQSSIGDKLRASSMTLIRDDKPGGESTEGAQLQPMASPILQLITAQVNPSSFIPGGAVKQLGPCFIPIEVKAD